MGWNDHVHAGVGDIIIPETVCIYSSALLSNLLLSLVQVLCNTIEKVCTFKAVQMTKMVSSEHGVSCLCYWL